ncbi:MAG: histidine--tRNA ligase [Deltaproteobacteria bacterium]|nr:histidine--tRNA ligase [Candidatus Anaeroferrophillus wilburensis]MBN2888929.1 histidine--tRNA ligase [Deltaproteobacteria bacterium]
MGLNAIKGFNDILPTETQAWQWIEQAFRQLLASYDYGEIRLPILEYTELFSRSIGDDTDIVEKEMYTFADRSNRSLTLRPEGTASVVRAFIQHGLAATREINKLYYLGPMFRYERPQKGRYRQFYQLGAEVFGEESFCQDAEMLIMLARYFHVLGISSAKLHLNSLGCELCRPAYRQALQGYLEQRMTALCADCHRRVPQNPLRALDCKQSSCRAVMAEAPKISDYLGDACREHFAGLTGLLDQSGLEYTIDPFMVRGLDYYTRTTFEFLAGDLGAQNAVAAGGRYDRLVEALGGCATPAIGFAIGLERLNMLVDNADVPESDPFIALVALGETAATFLFPLLHQLNQEGIRAVMSFKEKSLKSLLKKADRDKVSYALLAGDQELKEGAAILRNMMTKEQQSIPLSLLVESIREVFHGHQNN